MKSGQAGKCHIACKYRMNSYFHCHFIVADSCGFEFPSCNQSLSTKVTIIYNIRNMASIISPTSNVPGIFSKEKKWQKIIDVFWEFEYLRHQVNNTDEGD